VTGQSATKPSTTAETTRLGKILFPGPDVDAVVFDLDGVVTDTASVHEAAWKAVFDEFLEARARGTGEPARPFTSSEYGRYVDGKPRYAGAAAFLRSRGIELPEGSPSDEPGDHSVAALANRKNEQFNRVLAEQGVDPYPSTVRVISALRNSGVRVALITASRNGRAVLDTAGLTDLFEAVIDGNDAHEQQIAGKPAPDVFVAAAAMLGATPERAAIVEDSLAGVEAGKAGGFRFVLGVNRLDQAELLYDAGATAVVNDLSEVSVSNGKGEALSESNRDTAPGISEGTLLSQLPSALEAREQIAEQLSAGRPVIFLDYDGTLSPIVDDPDAATMPPTVEAALRELSAVAPVAIISGRDLADVRERASLDGVYYAGSHGFEIVDPHGEPVELGEAAQFDRFLPMLDTAESELRRMLHALPGVVVERKQYAVAVHFRKAQPDASRAVEQAVDHVSDSVGELKKTGGKKIFELRPGVDWDKGKAILALLDVPALGGGNALPVFVGDDLTDEDAFAVVNESGVSIAVRGEDERTSLAQYGLDDPEQAGEFLGYLAKRLAERGSR
jgi:trehalose 6-phosphate phosphatase